MPALLDTRFLNSARIQRIIETLASDLERMRPLTFLDRLTLVNAADDDIMGRFTAKQLTADLIADDQRAVVYESGQVDLFVNQLANIKIGQNISQAQLNMMDRLRNGGGRAAEEDAMWDWETSFVSALLQAVRERMNMLAAAMMIDSLNYDRLGIKLSNVTWGMPANLKVTPSILWSLDGGVTANAANSLPLDDIQAFDQIDNDNYGAGPYDRITMSSQAFRLLTASAQFTARASLVVGAGFLLSGQVLSTRDDVQMRRVVGEILGKELVIDDKTYREATNAGPTFTRRVLPANKVILDRAGNGPREWDFGNAIVTESIVDGLIGSATIGTNPRMIEGGAYGPLGYYTAQSPNLNPPGVNGWAVCRGFPRKHMPEASAVLTVF